MESAKTYPVKRRESCSRPARYQMFGRDSSGRRLRICGSKTCSDLHSVSWTFLYWLWTAACGNMLLYTLRVLDDSCMMNDVSRAAGAETPNYAIS